MAEFYESGYYNCDCLAEMKKYPDKYFDLAIVDPPYGGGNNTEWDTKARGRFGENFDKYEIKANAETGVHFHGRGRSEKYLPPEIKCHRDSVPGGSRKQYKTGENINHWDIAPPQEYFDELFRISKNQIIWGGNYFDLPPTRCFLVWRKLTISESFSMAMCEYAWTSFNNNAKWIEIAPQGGAEERFHPTQKPKKLYDWILNNYAKPGDKIIDTHVGSATSLLEFENLGYKYVGFEIDKHYYDLGQKRLQKARMQVSFFDNTTQKTKQKGKL